MKNLILILFLFTVIACTDNAPELIREKPQIQSNEGLSDFKSKLAQKIIDSNFFNDDKTTDIQTVKPISALRTLKVVYFLLIK